MSTDTTCTGTASTSTSIGTGTPAVVPVIDYEPPVIGGPPALPPLTPTRRQCTAPARPVRRPAADIAHGRAAACFADAALRRVLEVIDRRRPPAQLRGLMDPGLVDSLPTGRRGAGAARLRRVLAQPTAPDGTAAEVAASYVRGERVHALACRVEQVRTPAGPRWQVVALHLG